MNQIFASLLTDGGSEGFVATAAPANVDAQALDLLIERGQRDHEALRRFGLIPARALQHVDYDAALDLVHDLKERGLRMVGSGTRARLAGKWWQEFRKLQADAANDFLATNVFRQQINV